MDFASNLTKKAQSGPEPDSDQPNNPNTATNNPDFFSSAKVVAGAAQSQFRSEEYDREKAAGAGADLLNSASDYGKLDTTQGVGKYVDQAEEYLRQYNTNSTGSKIPESDESVPAGGFKPTDADESGGLKSNFATEDAVKATDAVDSSEEVIKPGGLKSTFAADDGVKDTAADYSAEDGVDSSQEVIKPGGLKSTFAADDAVKDTTADYPATDGADSSEEMIKSAIPTGDGVDEYAKKAEGFLSKESGYGGKEEKTGDYDSLKEEAEGYAKEAEGVVLGKPSGGEGGGEKIEAASETQSGGGGGAFGNVMKMAGGFLKK